MSNSDEWQIMAGIARDGAVELVFSCPLCYERMVAARSGAGTVVQLATGTVVKELYIGGVSVGNVAQAAAEFGVHVCEEDRSSE
jgi:hypothetical protein